MSGGEAMSKLTRTYAVAAAELRRNRQVISERLASLVADWPKYAEQYSADPQTFAALETAALVDYMALILDGSDPETFRNLYLGEKVKQFHDENVDEGEHRHRIETILEGERTAFRANLADEEAGRAVDDAFARFRAILTSTAVTGIEVLFVGDCLYLDVLAFLAGQAFADGVAMRPTFVTAHDPLEQRAALAKLADRSFGAIFYSPFSYGFDDGYANLQRPRYAINPSVVRRSIASAATNVVATLDTIVDLFEAPIFVHTPAPIMRRDRSARDRLAALTTAPARQLAAKRLSTVIRRNVARHAASGARLHIIDEAAIVSRVGINEASRFYYKTELQHPARFGALVADHYRDIVLVCARLLNRKILVCDLDNTLWLGVIGEGLGVQHYTSRQKIISKLKSRGVVLAINSKNDPTKIDWTGEGCFLSANDFVSRQINWEPKVVNMRRIASHLNIKEKDFVFVDDRADERVMVEEAFSGLLTLDALDDRTWRLLDLWAMLLPDKQNADRTEFYRQRDARMAFLAEEAEAGQEERAHALASLNLRVAVRQAEAGDLTRVTELINRTNQFNTTVARVTAAHIQSYAGSVDHRILIADAADRFGEMGTISVLIIARQGEEADITHFVLSCRVFGYGMEFAILERARKLLPPGMTLTGVIRESAYNEPCRSVFRDAGFAENGLHWRLADAASSTIAVPSTLALSGEAEPFSHRETTAV